MTDAPEQVCPFGDDCDLTIAYMSGFGRGKYLADRQTQEAVAAFADQMLQAVNARGYLSYEDIKALIPADAMQALEARDARVREAERERIAAFLESHEAGHTTRGFVVDRRPDNSTGQHPGMAYAAAIREGK